VILPPYLNTFHDVLTFDIGSKANIQPTSFFYEIEISDILPLSQFANFEMNGGKSGSLPFLQT
jgi:hypothetical protein